MLDLPTAGLLCMLTTIAVAYYRFDRQTPRRALPLPPGPKRLPFIGNFFDQPQESPWLVYDKWAKEHGTDIVSINVLGHNTIILNSVQVISDLLEKRSAIYSDRVRFPMLNDLIGWDWNFCFMHYGQRWRERRRMLNRYFTVSALRWLYPAHTKHSRSFLKQLLHSPNEFATHLREIQTASIMESVFAMDIKDRHDPFYEIAETAMLSLSTAGIFGTFYVDFFPFLQHIPSWFPGAGFQRTAAEWGKYVHALNTDAFKKLRKRMEQDEARPCIAKSMLDDITDPNNEKAIEVIQDATGIAFGAGADTSTSASLIFLLAMALYPEAQQKAQAEIDSVIGRDRLPDFSDQPNLPYVNALCKEVLRWLNVTPLSVAHATSEDDVYEGFFIPKGSAIVANTWAVTHDPEVYPEPDKFIPDRFLKDGKLDPTVRDPYIYTFGPGRRVCPGRFFALNSLYSLVSSVLACFTIEPPLDGIMPVPRMTTGVVSFPEPFDLAIKPRHKEVEALIENAVAEAQETN